MWVYSMRTILVVAIPLLIVFGLLERYHSYINHEFDQEFFETAINQGLDSGYELTVLEREYFLLFLTGHVKRTYELTLPEKPDTEGWKTLPRPGFEEGETLEWERIADLTGHWGYGRVTTISKITRNSRTINIYVWSS